MRHGNGCCPRCLVCRARDERGQTFPFVVTLLLALFIVAGVVINVGQAVNRRIFLQIAADAGAFTGATEMARGMNTIADVNGKIQRAWGTLTFATMGFTVTPCAASDLAVAGYGTVAGASTTIIDLVNTGYGVRARTEAKRVTDYNVMDLFPGEEQLIQAGESDADSGLKSPRPDKRLVDVMEVPSGTPPRAAALSPARKRAVWTCVSPAPQPRSAVFPLWFQKPPGKAISFVWVVKAPARRARVFDAIFGPDAIPAMTAAAAAKPVGGDIKEAKAEYVAKFIPVRSLVGSIWDAVKRINRQVHH
jgi:hypothetical protein